MGLDISVYKPIMVEDTTIEDFYILSENPELNIFYHLSFQRENEYFDIESAAKNAGYKLSDLKWIGTSYRDNTIFTYEVESGEKITLENPPLISKKEICIAFEEVGYQRKGANKKFYEDGMWNSPCIVDKTTLLDHWKKYFSHNIPQKDDEIKRPIYLSDEEMKKSFKENIVDKFVEGQTFVIYH